MVATRGFVELNLHDFTFLSLLPGNLRAINPENGFFGVAPGTSAKTNPNAMATIIKNTVFTNVAETSDGGVYWEGMDASLPDGVTITSWKNKPWSSQDGQFCSSCICRPVSQRSEIKDEMKREIKLVSLSVSCSR